MDLYLSSTENDLAPFADLARRDRDLKRIVPSDDFLGLLLRVLERFLFS